MANAKWLIDANELLLSEIKRCGRIPTIGTGYSNEMSFLTILEQAHPVEAVEVVHGRCEYCKDGKSFIGARLILGNDGEWHEINHCPNCGAKMDGGNDNGKE